ncbi:hypothetical protein PR202_gb29030 [Eleusine coracana subsp. coracana]|uniref:Uncharacterized protein n=1 Tax=Eleusine coracana subsp. coracana TaxID=191504 RepID=A0AAV5FZI0_ELECO|nr:hypothetical protein PR202_gb29030 [Eleusine coracana subsp. coracana]
MNSYGLLRRTPARRGSPEMHSMLLLRTRFYSTSGHLQGARLDHLIGSVHALHALERNQSPQSSPASDTADSLKSQEEKIKDHGDGERKIRVVVENFSLRRDLWN